LEKQHFFFFPFIIVMSGGTLWHLHRFLQCINYIIYEFTSSKHSPSFLFPLIPGEVSTDTTFAFTYIYTHFVASYSSSYLLSLTPPPSY
jgi:hypothetical protein